ncbi:MAG: HEAT repeat domain-containing protein [Planctomycetaceae bacterium]
MRLLPFLVLATFAAPRLDRHPWSAAVEEKTRHYIVQTNTFPELARSLGEALERAYPLFEERFGPLEGKARRPMRVALFRTAREYMELGDGIDGAIGHYDAALDRCALMHRGGAGEEGWAIAVHEAAHHYLGRRHPTFRPPGWYGEGMACWFEGLADPTAPLGIARLRARTARAALDAGEADLGLLLATRAGVSGRTILMSNFTPARFYALSWSLVRFLVTDARTRDSFRRFELRLFASRPFEAADQERARRLLEEECGPLAELEKGWHASIVALPPAGEAPRAPVYLGELHHADAYVRWHAAGRLGGAAIDRDLRRAAVALLDDPDLMVRVAAGEALAPFPDHDLVPAFVRALDCGEPALKATALRALAHPCADAAVPRLLEEVEAKGEREGALSALAAIGDPRAFPALRAALVDPRLPGTLRARCAATLESDPEAYAVLAAAAFDNDAAVAAAARASLEAIQRSADESQDRDFTAELQRLALEIEAFRTARREATATLVDGRRLPDPTSPTGIAALLDLLRDASAPASVRAGACALLGSAGARDAIPALRRLCGPSYPERLRLEAVRALVRLTGETRGFAPGQGARDREAAFRAWAE